MLFFGTAGRPIYTPPRLFLSGYYRLALAQVEQKDYEGALRSIQEGLKRQPDSTDLQRLVRTVKVGGYVGGAGG